MATISIVSAVCAVYLLGYFSILKANTVLSALVLKLPLLLIALWLLGITLSLQGIVRTPLTPADKVAIPQVQLNK